jgi:diguanylate cyclase
MSKVIAKLSPHDWAEEAIKLVKELGLHPYPQVFAIFFEYVRGSNKKLRAEIQKMLTDKVVFSEKVVETLHARHITSDFDKRILEESGQRVQLIMSEVLNAIDNTAGDSKSFTKDLDGFTKDLEETKETDVSKLLSKIITKTKEFKDKGEALQKKLEQSKSEVATLRTTLQEASTQMMMDGLTGVANRKAFDENITRLTAEARAENRQLCLLMVDIDHFKKFNDTFGHLIGDQVIKIVAVAMKDMVKGKDFVARYGGEEFAVILPDTPLKGGQIVAESLRSAIATRELKRKDTGESYGQITVSIGVALFNPLRDKVDDFISRADKALYTSKRNGRNRVTTEE